MKKLTFIEYGGGPDALGVSPYIRRAEALLNEAGITQYLSGVDVLGIAFYVDGSLCQYGIKGFKNVRAAPPGHIWARLGVPSAAWNAGSDPLRAFLEREIYKALSASCKRMTDRQIPLDGEGFMRCASGALETFLCDEGDYPPCPAERIVHSALRRLLDHRRLAMALGERTSPLGVPEGWTMREDPLDPKRIRMERTTDGTAIESD